MEIGVESSDIPLLTEAEVESSDIPLLTEALGLPDTFTSP